MAASIFSLCCAIAATLLLQKPVLCSRSNPLRAGLSVGESQAIRNQWTRRALLAVQKSTTNEAMARKLQAAAQWAQLRQPGAPGGAPGAAPGGAAPGGAPALAPGAGNATGNASAPAEPAGPNYTAIIGQMDMITNQAQMAAMTANDMVDVMEEIPGSIEDAETGEAAKAANREAKRALRQAKEMWLNTTSSWKHAEEIFNQTYVSVTFKNGSEEFFNVTYEDRAKEDIMELKGIAAEAKEAYFAAKTLADQSRVLAVEKWEEDAPNRKERKQKRAALVKKLKKQIQDQFWKQKWEKEDKKIAKRKKHCTAFAKCDEEDAIEWADTLTFKVVPETETPWYKKAMKQLKERQKKIAAKMPNITAGAPGGAPGPAYAPGTPGFAPGAAFALPTGLAAPAPAPGAPSGAPAAPGAPMTLNITLPPGRKVLPPIINGMSMIGPIFPPGIRCKPPPLKTKFINSTKGNLGWGISERECKVKCLETVNCSFAVYYHMYQSEESLAYEKAQLQELRDQIRYNEEFAASRRRYMKKFNFTFSRDQKIIGASPR